MISLQNLKVGILLKMIYRKIMNMFKHEKKIPTILVVTPSFKSSKFIDETILSVITQKGNFNLRYHIQDGGSNDETIDILKKWENKLKEESHHYGNGGVSFSWVTEPDSGMYDAINRGFKLLLSELDVQTQSKAIMLWINSDDIITHNAFKTVSSFFLEHPDIEWVTGNCSLMNENGSIIDSTDLPMGYSQSDLVAGAHEGRKKQFLQQEGTFWRGKLWLKCNGLDSSFRLAGDWDLWRRFAVEAVLVKLPCALGLHRRHASQLSNNMSAYYSEIDTASNIKTKSKSFLDHAMRAQYQLTSSSWSVGKVTSAELIDFDSTISLDLDFSTNPPPRWIASLSGLSFFEDWGRWSDQKLAPSVRIIAKIPLPPYFCLSIKMRSITHNKKTPIFIRVGKDEHSLIVGSALSLFSMNINNTSLTDTIDIFSEEYVSPFELGLSPDDRHLSIGFESLKIDKIKNIE